MIKFLLSPSYSMNAYGDKEKKKVKSSKLGDNKNWQPEKRFYHKINHFKLLQRNNEFNNLI